MVEVIISSVLFVTVGALVTVSLNTFLNVGNQVHTSYANSQEILPVATAIQRLIRSEVEPAPTPISTSVPVPPFKVGTVSTTSATFYANIGASVGPAQIVASLSGTTFTVTEQLPASSPPCPFSVGSTATCTYSSSTPVKTVARIPNVVNATWPSGSSTPVFTYTLLDNLGNQTVVSGSSVATKFTTCTYSSSSPLATTCPYDAVQGVEIDLLINSPGSRSSVPAEDDTIVYRLSATSYLYTPTVG